MAQNNSHYKLFKQTLVAYFLSCSYANKLEIVALKAYKTQVKDGKNTDDSFESKMT